MQIQELKSKYKGREALIVGTAPSLRDFSQEELVKFCENRIVCSIKQAYDVVPRTDFHFINDNNLKNYSYQNQKETKVVVTLPNNVHQPYLESIADFLFFVEYNWDFSKSLSTNHNLIPQYDLGLSPVVRRSGPGLLSEIVLYFIAHLGISRIYSCGVSGGIKGQLQRDHFFDSDAPLINPANKVCPEETEKEPALLLAFHEWLRIHGVEWTILDTSSNLPEEIHRCSVC
jgi:hypothetical protein